MKKIVNIIIACASLLIVSCSDWLDVSSSTQIKGDDLFTSEAGFQDALTGVYMNMASTDLYGKNMTWYFAEFLSEPYVLRTINSTSFYYVSQDIKYQGTVSQAFIEAIWYKTYTTIANINNALKALDSAEGIVGSRARKLMYGELYALRAYLHLDLMRLYGYGNYANRDDLKYDLTIPYVTVYSKDLTEQKSYAETMGMITADCEKAIKYLEVDPLVVGDENSASSEFNSDGYWSNRKSHLNYYAAKALLARAYMWTNTTESIAKAATVAQEVIAAEGKAYTWNTYKSVDTTIDRAFSTEQLFSINVYDLRSSISSYTTDLAYNASAATEIFNWADMAYYIFNAYSYDWDTGNYKPGYVGYDDYRFHLHVKATTYNDTNYYYAYKLYQTGEASNKFNDYIPLIKIDEMYYILAEKYLVEENSAEVLNVINTVRKKHGATIDITPELVDEWWSSARAEYIKELMRDFISEGQLFYYLKRLNVKSYSEEGIGINVDRAFDDSKYLLPYPTDELTNGSRLQ